MIPENAGTKRQPGPADQYRKMVILWIALVVSLGGYFLFIFMVDKMEEQSTTIAFWFSVPGILLVIISIAIKRGFLSRAEATQTPQLVQTGFVVAMALCEVSALLGVLARLAFGDRYYFVMFLIALTGMLLHFPRRIHLELATYLTREPTDISEAKWQ